MSSTQRLFVYGTLKRGGLHHPLMAGQRFISLARTLPRYRLHDVGGFPGMVEDPANPLAVEGEVWEVDSFGLDVLDQLEGTNEGLYARVPVPLAAPLQSLPVQTYLYLRPVAGCPDSGACWIV
ncbi:gamma-glutamylcyclotransferase family protein [Geminisphaera colitermitum]|uniref:gamma-glutamylcyclotransferase family protein n=1 Tax=Geminisphaera colitermitum TaxID=1148786 RepID=UPI000158C790|nr:gamma-glutamylcyclotransferase family protein [Geminisphaera colitermitum]